jgi:FkbM family methyltransferase
LTGELVSSKVRLDDIFAAFKQEGFEARSHRWRGEFDRLASPAPNIVLFGAGPFGQFTLDRLRRVGVEPCCFSDNNQALWETRCDGIEVLSPADAVARFGDTAAFVVTIFNGSAARMQLRQLGCRHVIPSMALFWKYSREMLPTLGMDSPQLLLEQESQIRECFDLLGDDASRHELCSQLVWRYWLEPESLPSPGNGEDIYFPADLIKPLDREVFVDCGAFNGDSIRSFFRHRQAFSHVYALEPDPGNRAALKSFLANQPANISERVSIRPYAVSNEDGKVDFVVTGTAGSSVSTSGLGESTEGRKLDSLEWPFVPTYIKMDIEGSEPKGLRGAARLIREAMPALAICLYHQSEHLWQIPNLIHSIAPGYSLFLRRYAEDCWEQVCYAVPRERLADGRQAAKES